MKDAACLFIRFLEALSNFAQRFLGAQVECDSGHEFGDGLKTQQWQKNVAKKQLTKYLS